MAMTKEELDTLITTLAEANGGDGLDNFAVLRTEVTELQDEQERLNGRISELEQQNGALKKENFKLFSRVGVPSGESQTHVQEGQQEQDPEPEDYMKNIIDEKGRWV